MLISSEIYLHIDKGNINKMQNFFLFQMTCICNKYNNYFINADGIFITKEDIAKYVQKFQREGYRMCQDVHQYCLKL